MISTCLTCVLVLSTLSANPKAVREWVFDKPGDLLGWRPNRLENAKATADGLVFRAAGTDPQLDCPAFEPFAATNRQVVEITWDCSEAGTGELFYANATEGKHGGLRQEWRAVIHVEKTGEQVTVVRPFWQQLGKIVKFRIDPPSDTTVRLKRVRIVERVSSIAKRPVWDFAADRADAWFGLANVGSMAVEGGGLTITSSAAEAVALAAVEAVPAEKLRYAQIELQGAGLPIAALCWATDARLGLSRTPLVLEDGAEPQRFTLDMAETEGWKGNITHVGVGFASQAGQKIRIRKLTLTGKPTGPAWLCCRYFGSADTIIRAGRPAAMALWLQNVGAQAQQPMRVRFTCPAGVKIVPPEAACPLVEPGKTAKIPCALTAASAGEHQIGIELGGRTVTRRITVAPAVPQTQSRYVPIPRPIETTHDVGIYYFPGWSPEQTKRWSHQLEFPERRPLLGLYREGDPEVADWHIKWAVENGIRLFIYDWYWRDGKEYIGRGLNDGFLRARYRNLIEFCVMWANHDPFASHTPEQLLTVTDYWAERYWRLRNYRRHDGKPVVVFFSVEKLPQSLGSVEKVHSAFDAMRARARKLGFPGIWFVGCGGQTDSAQKRLKAMGFDACSAYNYAGAGATTKHSPYELLMAAHEPIWQRATDTNVIPYTPLLTTGWDSRPWHGAKSLIRYGRTTAKWERGLKRLRDFMTQHKLTQGWLEAWNEWGEGSYIEPNVKFGFGDLEAIRRTFGRGGDMPVNVGPRDVSRGPYEIAMFRRDHKEAEIRVKTHGKNPNVVEGMDVVCHERSITVTAGRCKVGDKTVAVEETALAVDPADAVAVNDEMHPISDEKPQGWRGGTRLIAGRQPRRVVPGQLTPNSLLIQAAADRTATCYEGETDYHLDEYWGALCRLPKGRIKPKQQVSISYVYGLRRVDRVEVSADGKVTLRRGQPKVDCPAMPPKTRGTTTLATIYRPYHARFVRAADVFVVDEAKAAEIPQPDVKPVAGTLAKLRAGKPVTIVCWGDSVTVGGDASAPEKRYVDLFATRLRKRFPNGEIKVINAGIGGTSTNGRLKAYPKEVLAHKPDVITVEFVNDMGMPVDRLRANWKNAIAQARKVGAEFVVITPHYVMPLWMGKKYSRGPEIRANCIALRKLAAEEGVGLADAARRWELLEFAGIPYEILLMNGINHPDDRGHALFVDEMMRLLPK